MCLAGSTTVADAVFCSIGVVGTRAAGETVVVVVDPGATVVVAP